MLTRENKSITSSVVSVNVVDIESSINKENREVTSKSDKPGSGLKPGITKPEMCKGCPLFPRPLVKSEVLIPDDKTPDNNTTTDTDNNRYLWVVGEAPGYTEVRRERPFVGAAGTFLREQLQITGLLRFPVVFTNACLCHPENNATPSVKAIRTCRFHFKKLAQKYPPAFILILGKTAAKAFELPDKAIKDLRGNVFQTEFAPCLVTYHPYRILKTKYRLKGIFIEDLRKTFALVSGKTEKIDPESKITILTDEKEIIKFIRSIPREEPVAVDVETCLPDENGNLKPHGLDPYHPDTGIYTIAFAYRNQSVSFPVDWPNKISPVASKNIKNELKLLLKNHKGLIAHNTVFELKMFRRFLKVAPSFLHDTMILAYLIKEDLQGFYNLESLVNSFFPNLQDFKKDKSDLLMYNAKDAYFCLLLYRKLLKEIKNLSDQEEREAIFKAEQFILKYEVPVVAELELAGLKIDRQKLNISLNKARKVLQRVRESIEKICGVKNPRSKEFKEKLYQMYEYEPVFTEKGELATNKETLLEIYEKTENKKLKDLILLKLTFNSLDKIINTYLAKYPDYINPVTGRIHASYHITGTRTGRLSCSNPNFQQIPRDGIRICPKCSLIPLSSTDFRCPQCGSENLKEIVKLSDLIVPEPGRVILSADYSQIEVRIIAHLSQDPKLIEAIKKGVDIHSYVASELHNIPYEEIVEKKDSDPGIKNLRQEAKLVVFGLVYGITPAGLAKRINKTPQEAKKLIDDFYARFPDVKKFIEKTHDQVKTRKKVITETGRIRRFTSDKDNDLRKAQNFPVQSLASDITIAVARKILLEAWKNNIPLRIINLVHDEVKMEVPVEKVKDTEKILRYCMIDWAQEKFKLKVPLDIDVKITFPSSNSPSS